MADMTPSILLDLITITFNKTNNKVAMFGYIFKQEADNMGFNIPVWVKGCDFKGVLRYLYEYNTNLKDTVEELADNYDIKL